MTLSMRRVTALFGLLCLAGSVLAAAFAVFLLATNGSGPTFSGEESPTGQSVRLVRPTTLWAKPSTVDLSSVTCTAEELGGPKTVRLPLGHAPDGKATVTNSAHGTLRYLTRTSKAGFTVGSVTCTGTNLSAIVTARDSGAIHHAAGVAFLVAVPILLLLGLGIRRAGFRLGSSAT
jgi:hypothetical protein